MTSVTAMKRRPWTESDLAVLRDRYPTTRTPELARLLERPLASVYTKALQLGLRKTAAYMSESHGSHLAAAGVATRRKAGDTPWNRGLHYTPTGNGETRFKAGQAPHNTLPRESHAEAAAPVRLLARPGILDAVRLSPTKGAGREEGNCIEAKL